MSSLAWLRRMQEFYRMQNAPETTLHFKDAADELESSLSKLDAIRKAAIIHTDPEQRGAKRCVICGSAWDPNSPMTQWVDEWHAPICPMGATHGS